MIFILDSDSRFLIKARIIIYKQSYY